MSRFQGIFYENGLPREQAIADEMIIQVSENLYPKCPYFRAFIPRKYIFTLWQSVYLLKMVCENVQISGHLYPENGFPWEQTIVDEMFRFKAFITRK